MGDEDSCLDVFVVIRVLAVGLVCEVVFLVISERLTLIFDCLRKGDAQSLSPSLELLTILRLEIALLRVFLIGDSGFWTDS